MYDNGISMDRLPGLGYRYNLRAHAAELTKRIVPPVARDLDAEERARALAREEATKRGILRRGTGGRRRRRVA